MTHRVLQFDMRVAEDAIALALTGGHRPTSGLPHRDYGIRIQTRASAPHST